MSRQRSLIFWPVPLRKDREHSWKHHCRGGLTRELLGWVEVMAAKAEAETGRRFVFAKRSTILTRCFKGKRSEKKHYHIRKLDDALAELRKQHIFSQYFETADGSVGFVVAPHDSLCYGDGKTCLLPDRSAQPEFVVEKSDWRSKVAAAIGQSKRQRQGSEGGSGRAVKTAVVPVIDGSQNGSQNGSGQSLYDANFALLSDEEKADWLANGMRDGSSTRVSRIAEEAEQTSKPFYPRDQDDLKRHEEFLKKHAEKKQQGQDQNQQQERFFSFESKPGKTVEPTATPTPKGRKRPVLTPDEYTEKQREADIERDRADLERRLAENAARIAAIPLCPKCNCKHMAEEKCFDLAALKEPVRDRSASRALALRLAQKNK